MKIIKINKNERIIVNPKSALGCTFYENASRERNIGAGCRACGNPAYPNCMTSCPMFDD